jgi:hypothetical protein
MQLASTKMNGVRVHQFEGFAVAPNGEKFAVKGDDFSSNGVILVQMPDHDKTGFPPESLGVEDCHGEEIEIEARVPFWGAASREHIVAFQVPY